MLCTKAFELNRWQSVGFPEAIRQPRMVDSWLSSRPMSQATALDVFVFICDFFLAESQQCDNADRDAHRDRHNHRTKSGLFMQSSSELRWIIWQMQPPHEIEAATSDQAVMNSVHDESCLQPDDILGTLAGYYCLVLGRPDITLGTAAVMSASCSESETRIGSDFLGAGGQSSSKRTDEDGGLGLMATNIVDSSVRGRLPSRFRGRTGGGPVTVHVPLDPRRQFLPRFVFRFPFSVCPSVHDQNIPRMHRAAVSSFLQ